MDLDLEQKVWQRVSGGGEVELAGMERRCRESAAVFRALAQGKTGPERERLLQLHRREHDNAAAIRGLRILSGEEPEPIRSYSPPTASQRRTLSLAYRRSLCAHSDYCAAARLSPMFTPMAQSEADTMKAILAMMAAPTVLLDKSGKAW